MKPELKSVPDYYEDFKRIVDATADGDLDGYPFFVTKANIEALTKLILESAVSQNAAPQGTDRVTAGVSTREPAGAASGTPTVTIVSAGPEWESLIVERAKLWATTDMIHSSGEATAQTFARFILKLLEELERPQAREYEHEGQWQFWKPEDRFYHAADNTWWRFDQESKRLLRTTAPLLPESRPSELSEGSPHPNIGERL